jgi:hypothetical protein
VIAYRREVYKKSGEIWASRYKVETLSSSRYNSEAGTMVVEKRPNFRGAA